MKAFFQSLKTGAVVLALLTVLFGIVYPFFMYGVGQLFFHHQANGSLLYDKAGGAIGSEWIAQSFTKPHYFHPRPSAAGSNGYDGVHSSGSNLGPTSKALAAALAKRASDYRSQNKLQPHTLIPADAVTTSGSGLDPHISSENALLQAVRVASSRNIPLADVRALIAHYTQHPTLGIFGEARVNVLVLNVALDGNHPQDCK